ncbi:Skp1 domain-containing protein/Skp1_POZ domain-containing protein, partial [Cephalotus follicularis]
QTSKNPKTMSSSQPDTRIITLTTADDAVFHVSETVAMEMKIVKSFLEDNSEATESIPLPNVLSGPFSRIIEYVTHHLEFRDKSAKKEEIRSFDEGFLKGVSNDDLKELVVAANYLEIKELLDMLNQTVADRIKNKSVEYVRKFFGIESDFTEEEEAKIREEHAWAFEGVDPDDD